MFADAASEVAAPALTADMMALYGTFGVVVVAAVVANLAGDGR